MPERNAILASQIVWEHYESSHKLLYHSTLAQCKSLVITHLAKTKHAVGEVSFVQMLGSVSQNLHSDPHLQVTIEALHCPEY